MQLKGGLTRLGGPYNLRMSESLGFTWRSRMAPCVHEAGHAVIAHALGGTIAHVRVSLDGEGRGDSFISLPNPSDQVIGRLAGLPAEQRYCDFVGDCPPDRNPSLSAHNDKEGAWDAARQAFPDDLRAASELLAQSGDTAREMVDSQWDRIQRVALALFNAPDGMLKASAFLSLVDAPETP